MTLYRVFVSDMGGFRDSSKYRFIAEFAEKTMAANYVSYMRGKKRYEKQDIIIKEVSSCEIDSKTGMVAGVITVMGESLPVEEYEFK